MTNDNAALTTIPPGVKGTLEHRYRRLSPECHATLMCASVVGREFSLGVLETLTGETRQQLLPSLDEALRARLIERLGGSVGRYRFVHALVRETLYEALPSARRASLHQQAGEFLERVHAGELGPHLSMLAHHFFQAIPATDAGKAIDYALRAGERAASQFAHAEAVNHYRQALEALDLGPPAGSETRCEVLLTLGEACNHAGRYQEAQDAFTRAAEISRETGLPECLGRAAVGAAGLGVIEHGESGHLQLLEDAASALSGNDTLLRSHVLARLSIVLRDPETLERRWMLVDEADAIARRLEDRSVLLYSLLARHRSLWAPSFRDERLAVAREFTALAEEVGGNVAVPSVPYRMYDHLEIGEIDGVDTLFRRFTETVSELRQPQRIWITTNMRVMRELMDGRLDEAERLNDQARAIGEPAAPALAYTDHFMFRFFLYRELGRLDELSGPARQMNSWYPDDVFWQALLTVLHDESANTDRPNLSVGDLVERIERYSAWDGDTVIAGVLLSDCSEVTGHPERVERLYSALVPYAGFNAVIPNSRHFHCLGSVSHSLGLLASVLQRWDSAEKHFEDAIEMHSRLGAAAFLAHSRYAFARMLAERGYDTDHARSLELARQARDSANVTGMRTVARRAASLIAYLNER